jgi:hypothetical protein
MHLAKIQFYHWVLQATAFLFKNNINMGTCQVSMASVFTCKETNKFPHVIVICQGLHVEKKVMCHDSCWSHVGGSVLWSGM